MNAEAFQKSRRLRDLRRFSPLKSQFVLSGNVRDLQVHEASPGAITAAPLATVLNVELRTVGYDRILSYDPLTGVRSAGGTASAEGAVRRFAARV